MPDALKPRVIVETSKQYCMNIIQHGANNTMKPTTTFDLCLELFQVRFCPQKGTVEAEIWLSC